MELKAKVERSDWDPDEFVETKREALAEVFVGRVDSFRRNMTSGLHQAAQHALQTAEVSGEDTTNLSKVVEDAQQVQFEAHEEPPSVVDGVERRSATVTPSGKVGASGLTPELVGRAFEFGSAAHGVPATAWSREVVDNERRASEKDIEEVAKAT